MPCNMLALVFGCVPRRYAVQLNQGNIVRTRHTSSTLPVAIPLSLPVVANVSTTSVVLLSFLLKSSSVGDIMPKGDVFESPKHWHLCAVELARLQGVHGLLQRTCQSTAHEAEWLERLYGHSKLSSQRDAELSVANGKGCVGRWTVTNSARPEPRRRVIIKTWY